MRQVYGKDYRQAAERAMGRALRTHEVVHHHSETQLVVCDRSYHTFLHGAMRARGIVPPVLDFRTATAPRRTVTMDMESWYRLRLCGILESRSMVAMLRLAAREYLERHAPDLLLRPLPAWIEQEVQDPTPDAGSFYGAASPEEIAAFTMDIGESF